MPRPLALLLALAACAATAEPARDPARDPGGNVALRAAEVAALRAIGLPKRIEGECLSACTLYLGLPNACLAPGAVLGFHAPRGAFGLTLPPSQVEAVARLMAAHYPPRLAAWFLEEGRFSDAMVRVPAADLIARGEARACDGG